MAAGCAYCCWRGVVTIVEADLLGQALGVAVAIGEEMPAGRGAVEAAHVDGFLFLGHVEGFARVDADGYDFVLVAGSPGDLAHGFGLPVEDQGAQHGAVVIHQVENNGAAFVKILA